MSCTVGVADIDSKDVETSPESSDSPRFFSIARDELLQSPPTSHHAASPEESGRASAESGAIAADVPLPRPCACKKGGRNLVVCIDGTSNQFSRKENTNVVELYSRLKKDSVAQITFYNSGIGTYATPSWKSWSYYKQVLYHKIDLAIAWEFERIILSAYMWLSENYKDGDRIFLFGFSRGAYQVRALSAMIEIVGLIHRGNDGQIPFAYELYARAQTSDVADAKVARAGDLVIETARMDSADGASTSANNVNSAVSEKSMQERFKETFSRAVRVHFVGAWDTVSSVGIVRGKNLPGTADGMGHVCYFRHALALHERRVKFLPEYVRGGLGPDVRTLGNHAALRNLDNQAPPHTKEVWFAGSHSDIGGGPRPDNISLDGFGPSLRWMSFEALQVGLMLDEIPLEWQENSKTTESLAGSWKLFEYLPFTRLSYLGQDDTTCWPHLGQPRVIKKGQRVHDSAVGCIEAGRAVFSDDVSWDELVEEREHVELDVYYAAVDRIINALTSRSKRNQPLRQEELRELSDLLETERGKASLRVIESDHSSKESESIVVALLSGLVRILYDAGADPDTSAVAIDAAHTVLKVLSILNVRYRSERLRPAARALSKVDKRLADELMTKFTVLRSPLRGHTGSVNSVAFLAGGRRLVSSSQDNTVRVWDIKTGQTVIGPLQGNIIAAHGWRIASSSLDGTLSVWDASNGTVIFGPITAHKRKRVHCIVYSRDGTRIATAGDDHCAAVWDANTGIQLREMVGHNDSVMSVAFSGDGRRLVSGSRDKTIRIWDVASGGCVSGPWKEHTGWVNAVCFSLDGKHIFSSSSDSTFPVWDTHRLSNTTTTAETRALTVVDAVEVLEMGDPIISMALSPDGARLVSGSTFGRISMWMWDGETVTAIPTLFVDHEDMVFSVAFSPDGYKIASTSDKIIALWDADWKRWDMDDEDIDEEKDDDM